MDNDLRNRFRGINRPAAPSPRPVRPAPVVRSPQAVPSTPKPPMPVKQPQRPVPAATDKLGYASAGLSQQGNAPSAKPKKNRKKFGKKKLIIISLALVLLAGGGAFALKQRRDSNSSYGFGNGEKTPPPGNGVPNGTLETERAKQALAGTIRLVATGDMIGHESINANAKKADGSYDYLPLMDKMKPYFEKADVRFCNQATPAGGEQFGISGYPVFNAPLAFPRGIEAVGCNVINIGTNHTNDKGQGLIDATVAAWDNRPGVLAVAGANRSLGEQNQSDIFTVKGLKIAFISYTTYTNNASVTPFGINVYSDALATAQVAEARKNADFVIVSMRWGTEYSPDINGPQEAIAQKLTNLGADVILGHGPHVLEPVKKLKNADGSRESTVWYSLGNFLNTQIETEALIGGFAVMDIDAATKKVTKTSFMPTYMHYEWTAAEKRANSLLARKNLTMVPLDQAGELMAKSQMGSSVKAQTDRVTAILNKYTPVTIITSSQY
ncbi:CapA family protein [Candidatus Saccharibacteria bacterium]|nr:CapA family protein [Candidatus Saccharibacteria bacterium]